MPDINYQNVAPLIVEARPSGRSMRFVFQCPVSGAKVQATHTFQNAPSFGSQAGAIAERAVMYEVRRGISSTLRSMFGYNVVGRVAGDVASQAMGQVTQGSQMGQATYSDADKQKAAVAAFTQVANQFVWDPKGNRWVSARHAVASLSPFERQLAEHPVREAYDRSILARMMVEIVRADGTYTQEESDFLLEFLDPGLGTPEQIARRPSLSEAELGEIAKGPVRETLLLVAWVLALTDEAFDAKEKAKIEHYARGLGVVGPRLVETGKKAQGYILDRALESMLAVSEHDDRMREEIMQLADRIGMDRRTAGTVEAQFLKRRGG